MLKRICFACQFTIAFIFISSVGTAQDSTSLYNKVYSFPDKFFNSIDRRSAALQHNLVRSTEKYLKRLAKNEMKLQKKLSKKDSAAAQEIFGDIKERYNSLGDKLKSSAKKLDPQSNEYVRHLDSMKTALNFLGSQNGNGENLVIRSKVNEALQKYDGVQSRLNQTADIQKMLTERQGILQERLGSYGLGKQFEKYKQQVFYYRAQMHRYKEIINNPDQLESEVLKYVSKIPSFQKFFNKHSDLASLFRLPGEDVMDLSALEGLQTRAMLTTELQQRFGTGPDVRRFIGGGMANAQSGLNTVKDRLKQFGGSGQDMDMPDFKSNQQKTKTFLKRLQYEVNMQSSKSGSFFPMTTDIGMTLGYTLNEKSTAGIGGSYKMGLGKDIRHIAISHQGIGLRSFVDIKLKKSFWITGGYEINHFAGFKNFDQLKEISAWQQSGLIGISKKISLTNKILKSTKLQLLWDFLSYSQIPRPQPIIYRLAYGF